MDALLPMRPGAKGREQDSVPLGKACRTGDHRSPIVINHGSPTEPFDCGDLPFLIKRDGTWHYRGSPIERKAMVCLFSRLLKRDETGAFFLETPIERGRIEVEDAPFMATSMQWSGSGRSQRLTFRTNIDQIVTAGREHPLRNAHDLLTCQQTPYLHLRDGAGRFPIEARLNRAVYYELVALAEPGFHGGKPVLGVWSNGVYFPLGEIANPDT